MTISKMYGTAVKTDHFLRRRQIVYNLIKVSGNCNLVFADSFSVLRGKNRTCDNDYHSLFYSGLPCPGFKIFPYAPVELRALR